MQIGILITTEETMQRGSAADWAKRVERWKDSGLTAKEFAAEMGLNASTLTYWSWKLRADRSDGGRKDTAGAAPPKRRTGSRVKNKTGARSRATPKLVEVPVAEVIATAPMLELVLQGSIHVRVPAGFDESTLVRLMRAVEGQA